MTGAQLRAIRERAGMSLVAFGVALGYAGTPATLKRKLRRYEASIDPLPPPVEVRALAVDLETTSRTMRRGRLLNRRATAAPRTLPPTRSYFQED